MNYWKYILIVSFYFTILKTHAQQDLKIIANDTVNKTIDPLRPAKAAFYSALLPGAGQAYNKSYWKIPIVYAAIGGGAYAYIWNQNKYQSYRDEYKRRLAKETDLDPQYNNLSNEKLIQAQKFYEKNKDLSLLITIAFYALNIIDANVDAHLNQFNVNGDLTIKPQIQHNPYSSQQNIGLAINYNF